MKVRAGSLAATSFAYIHMPDEYDLDTSADIRDTFGHVLSMRLPILRIDNG
jgi:hypothetical protein